MRVRIKVCCISTAPEVDLAVKYDAAAVGLVSAMPGDPDVIPDERIRCLSALVPPGVASFLLTPLRTPQEIMELHRYCRTSILQLVDAVSVETIEALRRELPGIRLVQVIHVKGENSIEEARRISSYVDGLLLDSGNPDLPAKELGGAGRTQDWEVSREIVRASTRPVYLAGGLTPENVAEAIDSVKPFGVDVCNGVRTDGKLDEALLREFAANCGYPKP